MIRKYIIVADDSIKGFDEGIEKLEREWGAEEIEPSEDCISRESVMKCFKKWQPYMATRLWDYEQELIKLPSVTPSYNSVKIELEPCDDCISRVELLNSLKGFEILHNHDELRSNLIYGIMNLPSVTPQQTRWIPCSERLPQTDGVYIVTRRLFDNQIDTEPYYMVDACYFDDSNTWHNDNRINHGRPFLEDIIAWMPLPEPYRESEE